MMDGYVSDVYFNSPSGVAVDSEGNILVRVRYRKQQNPSSASFNHPFGIASNANNNLHISYFGNNLIKKVNGYSR